MIQFFLISIILFFNLLHTKDSEIRIEPVNEYCNGKKIAEKYLEQKKNDSSQIDFHKFTSIATNPFQNNSQLQTFYDDEHYNKLFSMYMLESIIGEEKVQQLLNECHVAKYGVSHEFLFGSKTVKGLYESRDFYDVANWIIDNKKLTHEQAKNIWNGYCNKRLVGKKEK